ELDALELAHRRSACRPRQPREPGEEAGDVRRELVDPEGLGRRPAFEAQAREPEREIEGRIADARVVPGDEYRAAAPDAEVVAPHVAVQELVALERGRRLRLDEHRERLVEPGARGEAEPEERLRVGGDVRPAGPVSIDETRQLARDDGGRD